MRVTNHHSLIYSGDDYDRYLCQLRETKRDKSFNTSHENFLRTKQNRNFKRSWPPKEVSEANQNEPTFHIKEDNHA